MTRDSLYRLARTVVRFLIVAIPTIPVMADALDLPADRVAWIVSVCGLALTVVTAAHNWVEDHELIRLWRPHGDVNGDVTEWNDAGQSAVVVLVVVVLGVILAFVLLRLLGAV